MQPWFIRIPTLWRHFLWNWGILNLIANWDNFWISQRTLYCSQPAQSHRIRRKAWGTRIAVPLTSSWVSRSLLIRVFIQGSRIFRHSGYRKSSLWTISLIVIIFCIVRRPGATRNMIFIKVSLEHSKYQNRSKKNLIHTLKKTGKIYQKFWNRIWLYHGLKNAALKVELKKICKNYGMKICNIVNRKFQASLHRPR